MFVEECFNDNEFGFVVWCFFKGDVEVELFFEVLF